jgi:hypothetical protein
MVNVLMAWACVALAAAMDTECPEDWSSQDIGEVKTRGSATYNEEAAFWTVRGSASAAEGAADGFQYVHRPLRGDGTITARVESLRRIDPWTKVGVMVRENLDPGSRFAAVYVTAGNGVRFQARLNAAAAVTTDMSIATEKQKAVTAPVWIKLERRGNQFHGYYATDQGGAAWVPLAWNVQRITMSEVVQVGLVVTSNDAGSVCEARFTGVLVRGDEITEDEIAADQKVAIEKAYRNLQRLGNWREGTETRQRYADLIASSLYAIARIGELRGKPADVILRHYYRILELVPESPFNVAALVRIAALDGAQGRAYAMEHLKARPARDRDGFHISMMKDCRNMPGAKEREAAIELLVEYVRATTNYKLLEQAIAALAGNDQTLSMYKSLIQRSMAEPAGEQVALVALRYMALQAARGWGDDRVLELAKWAASEFAGTKVAACATAAMADICYERKRYPELVEVLYPGFFPGNRPESEMVQHIESRLTLYLVNTLSQRVNDLEPIYKVLYERADASGFAEVSLHCCRKIAEARGLSLDEFRQSARMKSGFGEVSSWLTKETLVRPRQRMNGSFRGTTGASLPPRPITILPEPGWQSGRTQESGSRGPRF